jgi:hypothetical protein
MFFRDGLKPTTLALLAAKKKGGKKAAAAADDDDPAAADQDPSAIAVELRFKKYVFDATNTMHQT